MKKYDMWCLKHKLLSFILQSLFFCGVFSALFYFLEAPLWAIIVMDLFFILISGAYSNFSYSKELQNRVEAFYNCCPQPLYELVEEIKPYVKGTSLQDLLLNQTSALFLMGEHEKMLEMLENINVDKYNGTLLQTKIIYYNNLAAAYEFNGQLEKADLAYKKLKTLISDANPKIKKQFHNQTLEPEIFELKMAGEYKKALDLCAMRSNDKPLQMVENAYNMAELYLAMGDVENAKRSFSFVRVNGGSTFFVNVAQKKLDEIENLS